MATLNGARALGLERAHRFDRARQVGGPRRRGPRSSSSRRATTRSRTWCTRPTGAQVTDVWIAGERRLRPGRGGWHARHGGLAASAQRWAHDRLPGAGMTATLPQRRPGGTREVRPAGRIAGGTRTASSSRCTTSTRCGSRSTASAAARRASACSTSVAAAASSREAHGGRGAEVVGIDLAPRSRSAWRNCTCSSRGARSTTARPAPRRWQRPSRPASTSSPAWRCSSTCPTRPPTVAGLRRAAQARRAAVLLDHQPQAEAAFALAIVGAEYVLRLLPRGTHATSSSCARSELARRCGDAGLVLREVRGMTYKPVPRRAWLSRSTAVNYLLHAEKPA